MIRLFDVAMMADANRKYWIVVKTEQDYITICNYMDVDGLRELGFDSLDFDVEVVDIYVDNVVTTLYIKTAEKNINYLREYYGLDKWMYKKFQRRRTV